MCKNQLSRWKCRCRIVPIQVFVSESLGVQVHFLFQPLSRARLWLNRVEILDLPLTAIDASSRCMQMLYWALTLNTLRRCCSGPSKNEESSRTCCTFHISSDGFFLLRTHAAVFMVKAKVRGKATRCSSLSTSLLKILWSLVIPWYCRTTNFKWKTWSWAPRDIKRVGKV